MKKTKISFLLILGLMISLCFAQADSEWRGENRDGKYTGEKLLKKWPSKGPQLLKTINDIGIGYSSPAVTKDRIYVTGMIDGTGNLFSFDLQGKLLWKKAYGKEWQNGYDGARSTPTVAGNKIYIVSAYGVVFCYDKQGKKLWSLDMMKSFDAPNIRWGITESVLVDGDKLYCTPGSKNVSIAVLDRNTGKVLNKIKGNGQPSSYSSPVIFEHKGKRILTTMLGRSVIGIDVKTNQMIFQAEHKTSYDINPNSPMYHNGYLYVVSGYGTGGQLFKLSDDAKKLSQVWESDELDSQMGAAVIHNGNIYGSGHNNRNWHCIDFMTGEVKYSARKLGRKGNIVFADGLLYLYSEKGEVAIVNPNPSKFDIISKFRIREGSGEHWAHSVIRDGKLYIRHGDALNIYNIAR